MSHIDEGELTAYADGAYASDDAQGQRIRAHLAECVNCRNRLQGALDLSARAGEVLSYAAPAAVSAPPFEEIRAAAQTRPHRRVLVPTAWAASVIMALGLGWLAHDYSIPERTPQVASGPSRPAVIPDVPGPAATEQSESPARSRASQSAPSRTQPTVTTRAPEVAVAKSTEAATSDVAAVAPPPAPAPSPTENFAAPAHVIAGLAVASTRTAGDTIIVEQKLPDGTIVTITSVDDVQARTLALREAAVEEQRAAPARAQKSVAGAAPTAAAAPPAAPARIIVVRGQRRITVSAALPVDSLRALAAKIE